MGHLETIVALHTSLEERDVAKALIDGIPDWMQELHTEHSGRLAEIQALEEQVEEARKERRAAEAVIADEQEKLKRYQEQINQVSTQREYGALLQEIDTTKAKIREAEELGIGAMESRDQAEEKLAAERAGFEELDSRYRSELAKWEQEKPEIAARIARLETSIAELRSGVPRPLLAQFDRIRERLGGRGLAAIQEVDRGGKGQRIWHCSSCHYRVRPQLVVEIRGNGALVQCDSCKRILYFPVGEEVGA